MLRTMVDIILNFGRLQLCVSIYQRRTAEDSHPLLRHRSTVTAAPLMWTTIGSSVVVVPSRTILYYTSFNKLFIIITSSKSQLLRLDIPGLTPPKIFIEVMHFNKI